MGPLDELGPKNQCLLLSVRNVIFIFNHVVIGQAFKMNLL